jgi:ABC-type dipeptide/oligopeptide/nickel transport system permease subunit
MSVGGESAIAGRLSPAPPGRRRLWRLRLRGIVANPGAVVAATILVAILAYSFLTPALSPYDPNDAEFGEAAQGASLDHPLGTDEFGRDLFTRLAAGGQTSLAIVGLALLLILVVGLLYGTVAAAFGGKLDAFLMRTLDGLFALPRLPIAIVILAGFKLRAQNVQTIAFALGIVGWMLTARLVRGHMLSLKTQDYVRAARTIGASWPAIVRRHLIPNSTGVLLVAVLLELPTIVVGEAFLAVLGLGPETPTPTWGNIAEEGLHFRSLREMALATGVITAFALSANVLVDAVQDVLDPRRLAQRPARGRRWRPRRTAR